MAKLTKRFRAAQEAADLSKEYTVAEAVDTLAKLPKANFDETVELSMKLCTLYSNRLLLEQRDNV